MPHSLGQILGYEYLFLIHFFLRRREGWVKVRDDAYHPVFVSQTVFVLRFLDVLARFEVDKFRWGSHLLVARAHWADSCLCLLSLLLGKIRGSASAFSGNHNPTINQIILANFIERHVNTPTKPN